jgi:Rrf2 family protein
VYISAKADYAVRALLELAALPAGATVKAETLANGQNLPLKFLENTLVELRRAGIVASHRGADGGYRLARPAAEISVADVVRALDGPLAEVRGLRPEAASYVGPAEHLQEVWVAARASLRRVLDNVTLADVVEGRFPKEINALLADEDAWSPR